MRSMRFVIAVAGLMLSMLAGAQQYPSRLVKFVVPTPPSGNPDIVARLLAQKISESWGQPVTVDNRPGGDNVLGTDIVAKSPGDGYTWLMAPNNVFIVNPHIGKTPYDTFRDFTPVSMVARIPFLLVVHPSLPVKNVKELIDYTRANPGKVNYGSGGNGSPQHLLVELFKRASGADMLHIPYKGASVAVNDLLGGRVHALVGAAGLMTPHIRDGRLKLLATVGDKRLATFPDVQTIAETVPGFGKVGEPWFAVFMPANVPRDIVLKANAEIARVLNTPEIRTNLASRNIVVDTGSPEALAATLKEDYAIWGQVIREAKITSD